MKALFSPDSKFMCLMSRVGDLMVLNLLFLVTCIPIVTIGAAATSLYTICFRFGTDREGRMFRTYFQTFRAEFKQGTLLWLMLLLFGCMTALDAYLFYCMPGGMHWLFLLFIFLFILVVFILSYAFPLMSQFDNKALPTFKNALVLSLGYLPRSILMTAFNIFPFLLLYIDFYAFLQMGFLWVALYFSTTAYANSILLKKVFAPYLPEPEEPEKEDE